jgi:hypothetical protein
MGLWAYQPRALIELGRAWYRMPHRQNMLLYIGGGIVETLVANEAERPFLAQLRSGWVADLGGDNRGHRADSKRQANDADKLVQREGPRILKSWPQVWCCPARDESAILACVASGSLVIWPAEALGSVARRAAAQRERRAPDLD